MPERNNTPRAPNQAVTLVCKILIALSADFDGQSNRTILDRLNQDHVTQNTHPSQLSRFLHDLKENRFVEQDESGLWRLAPPIAQLAESLRNNFLDVQKRQARRFLALFSETPESASAQSSPTNGDSHDEK